MICNVAFIGLGVMGYPMAGYISKGGHNVTVFNRTKSKAEKWIGEYKGKMAETPADAAKDAEYIFTCVGNDNDLREVTIGKKGIFNTIKKGSIYIDNTTASATVARELYKNAKAHGFGFLDAPVSGGQAGAENGALTVMVGGDKKDFDKAKEVIKLIKSKKWNSALKVTEKIEKPNAEARPKIRPDNVFFSTFPNAITAIPNVATKIDIHTVIEIFSFKNK